MLHSFYLVDAEKAFLFPLWKSETLLGSNATAESRYKQLTERQDYFCNVLLTDLRSILHNRKQCQSSKRFFKKVLVDTGNI